MIQAAPLDYAAVSDRMRAIVARGVAPTGCWVIAVPAKNDRGIAWQMALAGLWTAATFNSGTRLAVHFEELAEMPAESRVLVLIGVRNPL